MRAVIQRVSEASVRVADENVAQIARGLLIYIGVAANDEVDDANLLADKVRFLRIFEDESGKMNLDVLQAGGSVLVVSAFTLQADARRGRRPTLEGAARGEEARVLYESFCETLLSLDLQVARGVFGGHMHIHSVNDGPVCILLDSRRLF